MKSLEQRYAALEAEHRKTLRELDRTTRQLADARQELDAFARVVSHDFRTPLFNVIGFTAELERLRHEVFAEWAAGDDVERERLAREFDEAFGFVNAASAKLVSRIEATLWILRSARGELEVRSVDLDRLVRDVAAPLRQVVREHQGTLLLGPMPAFATDPNVLSEVLRHLLHNAVNYLRDDVPFHVEVTGELTEGALVLAVHDNGRGIPVKDQSVIFQLFHRSQPADRSGEGLGLAHVRALVRKLGGTVGVRSEPGIGSTFYVELPRLALPKAGERVAAASAT